jgi:hypothetical protein
MNIVKTSKTSRSEIVRFNFLVVLFALTISGPGCSDKDNDGNTESSDTWDIDKDGIPRFVQVNYIELDKIYRISKFRSSAGHDYSDAFEHCRSMKHYFEPRSDVAWDSIKIYSPVTGRITRIDQEWAGTKLEIAAEQYPAFRFSIFHINSVHAYTIDEQVTAGQQLGNHFGSQTMSDIAVMVNDPTRQGRLISYFDVLSNDLFTHYSARGVITREMLIIPTDVRDSNPLTCNGDTFVSSDTLENWVILN